ncbi:MAG: hypothetical protein PHQ64_01050 [Bacilli bacterium]|nr:hypothetical protein [Bacilli bacterium]
MDVFVRFLYDFLTQFFGGIMMILRGLVEGFIQMINIGKYFDIIKSYSKDFTTVQWVMALLAALVVFLIIAFIIFIIVLLFKKYIRVRKTLVEQETLLEEVAKLNHDVLRITQEKDRILAMKVSQLGLNTGESSTIEPIITDSIVTSSSGDNLDSSIMVSEDESLLDSDSNEVIEESTSPKADTINSRFYRLSMVDKLMETYKPEVTDNEISLTGIVEMFRNFACSNMRLYYKEDVIRLFLASFGATRLIILQGISGTGKTSLPYAWGKFVNNDAIIASVQPSWRDRTELFGYFNEFTKKFNETEVLAKMYEARYIDKVYLTILDEMNIARVEYYFAEMLSILEMPSRDEWIIELTPDVWDTDPKGLDGGKLKLPDNMWYIGTINNDDSTFMVTDKVYDRAIPIDINDKGAVFDAPITGHLSLSSKYLESLFDKAKKDHPVSEEAMKKLEEMDNYVIEHFRIAFGNRIVKQMRDFVPVFVGCGGTEIDGIDYIVSHKILRKFEQLNLSYIRDEIPDFIKFLDKTYGKENMNECKDYLNRLRKLM